MHPTLISSCLIACLFATPDVLPPGMRGVKVDVELDAKAFTSHCCVQYVIQKGDALAEIAKRQLGDERRLGEIVELNPTLDPQRLVTGRRLWLPPSERVADTPLTFVFLGKRQFFGGTTGPFAPSEQITTDKFSTLTFLLVPMKQLSAFEAARQKGWEDVQALVRDHTIEQIAASGSHRLVQEGSPIRRRHDRFTVVRDEKGAFSLQVESTDYDKDGKVVQPAAQGNEGDKKESLLLLLLAAAGGGALLLRARRVRGQLRVAEA